MISKNQIGPKTAQNGANDPRLLILKARRVFVLALIYAAVLSACIGILQLSTPLYMMQVHDRVLNSQSMDTLTMLTILVVGALIIYGVLEYIRALTFQAMGSAVVRWLNLPVLTAAVQAAADQGLTRATQSLRRLVGDAAPMFGITKTALAQDYGLRLVGSVSPALDVVVGYDILFSTGEARQSQYTAGIVARRVP